MIRLLPLTLLLVIPAGVSGGGPRSQDIRLLIAALNDANVRQGASIGLAKLGEPAVGALIESLVEGKPVARVWSAYTLGRIGASAESAVEPLLESLVSSDAALRAASAQALGEIGSAKAVEALARSLVDEDLQVQKRAAVALGHIGPTAKPAAKRLIEKLIEPEIRVVARAALVEIGAESIDALVDSLQSNKVRFDVLLVLREVGPQVAQQKGIDTPLPADLICLRAALNDLTRPLEDRALAARSLVVLDGDGLAELTTAFSQPEIARTAAEAFADADSTAVPALLKALDHQQANVRATAADALGHIGIEASDAAAELTTLLKDKDRNVRYHAVRALHELGQHAKPAVVVLSELILDSKEQEPTRNWAIKTLVVTLPATHDEVVKTLVEASGEETNYGVRQLARTQLRQIDAQAADAAGIR